MTIKITKKQIEIEEHKKFCDDCGKHIPRDMACSVARCEICGKDLCKNCIDHEESTFGDYRIVYCKRCWDIGNSYRQKIKKAEAQIDLWHDEWKKRCCLK